MPSPSRPRHRLLFPALAALLVAAVRIGAAMEPAAAGAADRDLLERVQREHPLWIRDGRPSAQAQQLRAILHSVEHFGLSSEDFAPLMPVLDASADPLDTVPFERAMNLAALRLMRYLHDGRVDPRAAGYELSRRRAPYDGLGMLKSLASSSDVSATLAALEPRSSQYGALKQWLARYRGVPEHFIPAPMAGKDSIRVGDAYADAMNLRRRLEELGDLPLPSGTSAAEDRYDPTLAEAIAHFQRRHGLQPDGVLGPRTMEALAIPISRRIRQIELTLERWRWLPDLQAPAVIVNVPQYMLYMLPETAEGDAGEPVRRIPVIVGKRDRQTPVFDSRIEAVVIRPYWEVPRSIARDELLPLIERDASYLSRHDMEIVRGGGNDVRVLPAGSWALAELRAGRARLRQRPGPDNALGLIKFVLPNRHDVYLHSTPEARLFARDRRALSHGCIRVSDATALAAYLLRNTPGDWSVDAIEAATCADATFTVRLARPVPVFILYGTVVVDRDGVQFFDDIYGYDRRLEALLTRGDVPESLRSAMSD